ncbi:MAG TPA: hypothetical protein VNC84_02135 [Gammaproteobacteria bacterium]|jgi:hypothetical protein|nr:hypothetical protein [Gammaproteobacteria bacterium]
MPGPTEPMQLIPEEAIEFNTHFGQAPISDAGREEFKKLLAQAIAEDNWFACPGIAKHCSYQTAEGASASYFDAINIADCFALLEQALEKCDGAKEDIQMLLGQKFISLYSGNSELPARYMQVASLFSMLEEVEGKVSAKKFVVFKNRMSADETAFLRKLLSAVDDFIAERTRLVETLKLPADVYQQTAVILNKIKRELHDLMVAYCKSDDPSLFDLMGKQQRCITENLKAVRRENVHAHAHELASRVMLVKDGKVEDYANSLLRKPLIDEQVRTIKQESTKKIQEVRDAREAKKRTMEGAIDFIKQKIVLLENISASSGHDELIKATNDLTHRLVLFIEVAEKGMVDKPYEGNAKEKFMEACHKEVNNFCNKIAIIKGSMPSDVDNALAVKEAAKVGGKRSYPGLFQGATTKSFALTLEVLAREIGKGPVLSRYRDDPEHPDFVDSVPVVSPAMSKIELVHKIQLRLETLGKEKSQAWMLPWTKTRLDELERQVIELLEMYMEDRKDATAFIKEYRALIATDYHYGSKSKLVAPFIDGEITGLLHAINTELPTEEDIPLDLGGLEDPRGPRFF